MRPTATTTFAGLAVVNHDVNRIEVNRIRAMALQQLRRNVALQRGEPNTIAIVALQEELDKMIAETADPIVEDN